EGAGLQRHADRSDLVRHGDAEGAGRPHRAPLRRVRQGVRGQDAVGADAEGGRVSQAADPGADRDARQSAGRGDREIQGAAGLSGRQARIASYWREEFALIAILLLFFIAIVALSYDTPFDARLFPLVIGGAGIVLMILVAVEQIHRRALDGGSMLGENDPTD